MIDLASEDSWDSYLGARSANFRQQARRRARKLHGLGVRFRLADNPAQLESDFDALRSLHAARWGAASAFNLGAPMAFHRDFAAVALEQGWLRLWWRRSTASPSRRGTGSGLLVSSPTTSPVVIQLGSLQGRCWDPRALDP